MYKGTTPTVTAVLPDTVDVSGIKQMWFTFAQNGTVKINKTLSQLSRSGRRFSVTLTQAETLSLDEKMDLDVQIRILLSSGKAIASAKKRFHVSDVLKGGEITSG